MNKEFVEKTRKLLKKDIMSRKFYAKESFDGIITGVFILCNKTPEEISAFLDVPLKRVAKCLKDFENDEFYWRRAAGYLAMEKENAAKARLSKKIIAK